MSSATSYRADIDGLRAIAVISVLLFHLDIELFSGGFIGVDVFFVISGFLITRLIVEEVKQTGRFSFSNFYVRRIRRLFPAFLTVLGISTIVAISLFAPHDLENFGASAFHSIFSVSNIYFWREAGYFDSSIKLNPLLHTWSLSVEEQFYLVWPITILFFATRFGMNAVLKVLIFVIISSLLLNFAFDQRVVQYFFPQTSNNDLEVIRAGMFYLGPFRNFELGLGALLVFFMHKRFKNNMLNELIFLAGLVLVIVPFFLFTEEIIFPSYNALIPCIGAVMIIFAGNPKYSGALLRNKLTVAIGLISYSLYLVHWPVIVFYKYYKLTELTSLEKLVLAFVSVVLAFLVYKFIEQRWRKPLKASPQAYMPNSGFVVGTLCISITFAIISTNQWATNGWPWRLSEDKRRIFQQIDNPRDFHLQYYGGTICKPNRFCTVNSNQDNNIYFIGDSHSQQYAYGLSKIFPSHKFTHIDNRCRFSTLDYCFAGKFQDSKFVDAKVKELELLKKSSDLIIIGQAWWEKQRYYNTKTKELVKFDKLEEHVSFLVKEILKVEGYLGKGRVLVMGQVNRFGSFGSPLSCLGSIVESSACKTTEATFALKLNALLGAALGEQGIPFISPTEVMCNESSNRCLNLNSRGLPLYSDAGHLSIWGSEYVVERLKRPLEAFFKTAQ